MSSISEMKTKLDNTFWDWDEDNQYIRILWILETEDGKYYQKLKTIRIGEPSTPRMPLEASRKARGEFNSESGVDTPERDKSSVRPSNEV